MKKVIFLQKGDVFQLKNGMKVYYSIPEKFVYQNRVESNKKTNHNIIVGETYQSLNSDEVFNNRINKINKRIGDAFNSEGFNINPEKTMNFIKANIKQTKVKSFVLNEGEFVVINTSFQGGGTGMGSHDVYPNGHFVRAKRLINGEITPKSDEITFYQSGAFTAMITDVKPIRHMKLLY